MAAYGVVAKGLPDDAQVQETFAELAGQQPGNEDEAIAALRRALPNTANPRKVCGAAGARCRAMRKDYDAAWLAAQVVAGLIGEVGAGREGDPHQAGARTRRSKEVAQRALTDRLWQSHLFHPKVRGPLSELMAILFEQVGHLYAVPFPQYQIDPKRHRIDVGTAQEYQSTTTATWRACLGMEAVELYSPFLVATRERMAKRTNEPAPEPMIDVEMLPDRTRRA